MLIGPLGDSWCSAAALRRLQHVCQCASVPSLFACPPSNNSFDAGLHSNKAQSSAGGTKIASLSSRRRRASEAPVQADLSRGCSALCVWSQNLFKRWIIRKKGGTETRADERGGIWRDICSWTVVKKESSSKTELIISCSFVSSASFKLWLLGIEVCCHADICFHRLQLLCTDAGVVSSPHKWIFSSSWAAVPLFCSFSYFKLESCRRVRVQEWNNHHFWL